MNESRAKGVQNEALKNFLTSIPYPSSNGKIRNENPKIHTSLEHPFQNHLASLDQSSCPPSGTFSQAKYSKNIKILIKTAPRQ